MVDILGQIMIQNHIHHSAIRVLTCSAQLASLGVLDILEFSAYQHSRQLCR